MFLEQLRSGISLARHGELQRLWEVGTNELLDAYYWKRSRRELVALIDRYPRPAATDIMKIIDLYRGAGWYARIEAYQVRTEFVRLCDWAAEQSPLRVMEIGTARGGTLLGWSRIASDLVISIDLPAGVHGGGYPRKRSRLLELFTHARDVRIQLLRMDSHESATKSLVASLLGPHKLDILFIDGDHTFEGVRRDFALWADVVRDGGFVVFHDIIPHSASKQCEVPHFWHQLKNHFHTFELVENAHQGWAGLGMLQMCASTLLSLPLPSSLTQLGRAPH